ncbi:g6634 [Coccomyxa viridis]|uniref:G6634 protein n=1 Tax=Coccomyxa viridis TaxID=1274662 RepID=A0ABP1FYD8_9CHLO
MGKLQINILSTLLLLLLVSTEHRSTRAIAIGLSSPLSTTGGLSPPRRGLISSGHSVSDDSAGSLRGQGRRLQSQTCIGVSGSGGSGSGKIGCGLQWGLPSCCDSNPNTNSGYNCQPNTPIEGCPSGKYAACCTLF